VVDDGVGLDLAFVVFLHVGAQTGAESGRESCGLGGCGDGFAGGVCGLDCQYVVEGVCLCKESIPTFVLRAADFAGQICLAAGVGFEKVTAIGTEDEGSNGGHFCNTESDHVEKKIAFECVVCCS
jgi:hypothetical protein